MTKRSKLNPGLKEGEKITKPNKYFSESEKRKIVEEYLNSDCTKSEIWEKYTGCSEERAQLLRWLRQLGYTDKRPNPKIKKFTTDQKHAIIHEYLLSDKSKQEIWFKFTGKQTEHGIILKWMRKLGYDDKERNTTFAANISEMSKVKSSKSLSPNTKALQDKIARLEKELEEAKIKAIAYSTMIDIAEQELDIPIRKKLNTKPLKK